MQFVKVNGYARDPIRQTKESAGFDLCSSETVLLEAFEKRLISTGLKIAVPEGTYGQIMSRSGLAANKYITAEAGVIDRGIFYLIFKFYLFY
jgi:dUTP pyrophosphatase